MLFSAPAFAFLFLPLSLMIFSVFAKSRKRIWMFAVCVVYQILLFLSCPINLVYLPALCLYTFFVRKVVRRKCPVALAVILQTVPFAALIGIRYMAYLDTVGFVYPVGLTLPVLCSLSFIIDSKTREECPDDILSLASYLYFFPTMLVGPIIKYRDFCRLISDENITVDLKNAADGVRIYIIGFVKRIAVGAVLVDGYKSIFAYSWEAPSFMLVALMILLIYFGVSFSLLGYYDMSVGVARMFGVNIAEVSVNPFTVATVSEYFSGLFGSFKEWTDEYIISPIYKKRPPRYEQALKICIYTLGVVLLVRCELHMLILAAPLFAFAFITSKLKLDKKSLPTGTRRVGRRIISGIVCVGVIGFFWLFITLGSAQGELLEYIGDVSFRNAEYQTDMVLLSISGAKYLFVILLGLCTVLPFTKTVSRLSGAMSGKIKAARDCVSLALLLAMFLFTAMFFLPQFSAYSYAPFDFIIM